MLNDHRQYLHHETLGDRLFEVGEEVPYGWYHSLTHKDSRPVLFDEKEPEVLTPDEEEPKKKYPSQMTKDELIELGTGMGLELDDSMTAKAMRDLINGKVSE